jgi:hypothetical protein
LFIDIKFGGKKSKVIDIQHIITLLTKLSSSVLPKTSAIRYKMMRLPMADHGLYDDDIAWTDTSTVESFSNQASISSLIRLLQQNDQQQDDKSLSDVLGRESSVLIIASLFLISLFIFFLCAIRSLCLSRYQRDICVYLPCSWCFLGPANRRRPPSAEQLQLEQDAALALQLQNHMTEQERDVLLKEQRRKRQAWYDKFLRPYTMTIKEGDLLESDSGKVVKDSEPSPENSEYADDIEVGAASALVHDLPGSTHEDDDDDVRILCLPALANDSVSKPRRIESECTVCLVPYNVGDVVVWNTQHTCPHVFHYDCLMTWLVRGKKRCPCCREWFVPPQRISEQQRAWRESHHASAPALPPHSQTTDAGTNNATEDSNHGDERRRSHNDGSTNEGDSDYMSSFEDEDDDDETATQISSSSSSSNAEDDEVVHAAQNEALDQV